jgi:quercetin dioxygenase-like cupin family protein
LTHADPARALLEAVLAFYAGRGGDGGEMLDAVRAELAHATPFSPSPAPRAIPAAALLRPALRRMKDAPLAAAIEAAVPLFHWRQNPNYTAETMGAHFMGGYGYVEFAGPRDALFQAPQVRVGLLLLASGVHYPPHAHPAEELYHPLTESGLWRRGTEAWRSVPAGMAIHHPPMVPHETRATDDTLLALYCWRGNTATEARPIA